MTTHDHSLFILGMMALVILLAALVIAIMVWRDIRARRSGRLH
jgi:hypothetical protein